LQRTNPPDHSITSSARSKMDGERGLFARRLLREMDSLWVFLMQHGVEPTNNRAERALRFGVQWRKRSLGTASAKGNRWVERILSLKETRRLRAVSIYQILVEAMTSLFTGQPPHLAWLQVAPHMRCGDHVQAPLCNRY
jgi:transposase